MNCLLMPKSVVKAASKWRSNTIGLSKKKELTRNITGLSDLIAELKADLDEKEHDILARADSIHELQEKEGSLSRELEAAHEHEHMLEDEVNEIKQKRDQALNAAKEHAAELEAELREAQLHEASELQAAHDHEDAIVKADQEAMSKLQAKLDEATREMQKVLHPNPDSNPDPHQDQNRHPVMWVRINFPRCPLI